MDPVFGIGLVVVLSAVLVGNRVRHWSFYVGGRWSLFTASVERRLAVTGLAIHGRRSELQVCLLMRDSGEPALGLVLSKTEFYPHQFEAIELSFGAACEWALGLRAALEEAAEILASPPARSAGPELVDSSLPAASYFDWPVEERLCGVVGLSPGGLGGRRFLRLFRLRARESSEGLFGLDFSDAGIFKPSGLSPMVLSVESLSEHLRQIESLGFS